MKKKRTFKFDLDLSIINTHEGIAIDMSTLKVHGVKNGVKSPLPGNIVFDMHYKRESGKPKYLQQFCINGEKLQIDANLVLTQFDQLFFVDTNKKQIGDDEVCLGAVIHSYSEFIDENKYQFNYRLFTGLEYHNVRGKFENLVWKELISAILNSNEFNGRIALVVDSDLGNLNSYNKRVKPIYGDFYLPEEFTLIYATAEKNTKNDSVVNKMMYECDRAASSMLSSDNLKDARGLHYFKDKPYTAFRQWFE